MDKDRSESGSEGVLTVAIHERINVPHIRGHFHHCAVIHGTGGQIPNPGHLYSCSQAPAIAETSHWDSFSCAVSVTVSPTFCLLPLAKTGKGNLFSISCI